MQSSSLIDRIDRHLCGFKEGMSYKESYFGLGSWVYTFPTIDFEFETQGIVFEVAEKYQEIKERDNVTRIFFEVIPILENEEIITAIYNKIASDPKFQNWLNPLSSLIDRIDRHLSQAERGKIQFELETRNIVFEVAEKYQEIDEWDKVTQIFFEVIPILKNKKVKAAIYKIIASDKEFQNWLDPYVTKYRREKSEDPSLINNSEHQLDRRIAKARLALKLGFLGESAGTGMSGATFMRFVNGKKLGLFKASNEHQSYWKTLHDGTLSYVLHNQPFYLKTHSKAGVQAEVAAYIFSETLDLNLVPPTKLVKFGDVEGSFQLLVPEIEELEVKEYIEFHRDLEAKRSFSEKELNIFQIFAVFDYVIGNLDRHHRNWFIGLKKDEHHFDLVLIFAIDHDRCFPQRNPRSTQGLRSQYQWRDLKIAKEPMTDKTKYFIRDHLKKEQILTCIDRVKAQIPDFFNREMILGVEERIQVLQILAGRTDPVTLNGLGNLRTDCNIQRFLSH